jgi:PDZ domain
MNKLALVFAGTSLLGSWLGAATQYGAALTWLQEKPGVVLRVTGESRTVEVNGQCVLITVERDGSRYAFSKDSGGSIKLLVTRDGRTDERKFDSEAALKEADSDLHGLYQGSPVKVFAESAPAERDSGGERSEFRGGAQGMEEFRQGVERLKNGESGLMADGDLDDAEVKRLSKEARERLERDMRRLEERDRENGKERDPEDKTEEAESISQDRYLASLRALERSLLDRCSAIKSGANGETLKSLDDVGGKIKDTYADLRDKVLDENKKTWGQTLEKGRKFFDEYSAQLDGWEKKIGGDAKAPNPYDDMRDTERRLIRRVKNLRRAGGDKFEDILDNYEDKIKDTYADMYDKLKDDGTAAWKPVGEMHVKFSAQMEADLDKVAMQIDGAKKPQEREPQPEVKDPPKDPDWKDNQSPERDVELPAGAVADVVGGVRVSRLSPLVRKQLNLENGLSVNEIVNADGILAESGLEVYDIILEINGEKVDTRGALRDAVAALKKGEDLKLTIMRDGKKETLKVKR